ncbi:hypothetical protein ig2599ANME_0492 [groundwater metagenome]
MMEFKVQQLQIKAGKYKVILNPEDAKEIGDMISRGTVGVYQDMREARGRMSSYSEYRANLKAEFCRVHQEDDGSACAC